MKILIACEYSGTVRDAFIALGHDAMSCDLLPTDAPGPHYQGDVRDVLYDGWCALSVIMNTWNTHKYQISRLIESTKAALSNHDGELETFTTGSLCLTFGKRLSTTKGRTDTLESASETGTGKAGAHTFIFLLRKHSLAQSLFLVLVCGISTGILETTRQEILHGERTLTTRMTNVLMGHGIQGTEENSHLAKEVKYAKEPQKESLSENLLKSFWLAGQQSPDSLIRQLGRAN